MTDRDQARGGRSAGFVLVEILVGLAVLGLAAAYAFPTLSGALGWSRSANRSTVALVHARSLLDRIGHDVPPHPGVLDGTVAEGLAWRIEIIPYDVAPMPALGDLTTMGARVTLRPQADVGSARALALTTLIPSRAGGP